MCGRLDLAPRTVADFYAEVMSTLGALKIDVKIHAHPDEVANPIPFAEDRTHKSYDRESVDRFQRFLISVGQVFRTFARDSSANAARCTSSGAASISR